MRLNIHKLSYGFVKLNKLCTQFTNTHIVKLLVQINAYLICPFPTITTVSTQRVQNLLCEVTLHVLIQSMLSKMWFGSLASYTAKMRI
jgi:hypothetical protein